MGKIEDGTGRGYGAAVDADGHLKVLARAQQQTFYKAAMGQLFLIGTNLVTLTANGGKMVWVELLDPLKSLVIDKITISWNGGTSSRNKALTLTYSVGDTVPTTNITEGTPLRSTYLGSANTMNCNYKKWDGVGDGMTGGSPGLTISQSMVREGYSHIPLEGAMIFPPGSKLALTATPEGEGGLCVISVFAYLADLDTDVA